MKFTSLHAHSNNMNQLFAMRNIKTFVLSNCLNITFISRPGGSPRNDQCKPHPVPAPDGAPRGSPAQPPVRPSHVRTSACSSCRCYAPSTTSTTSSLSVSSSAATTYPLPELYKEVYDLGVFGNGHRLSSGDDTPSKESTSDEDELKVCKKKASAAIAAATNNLPPVCDMKQSQTICDMKKEITFCGMKPQTICELKQPSIHDLPSSMFIKEETDLIHRPQCSV